MTNFRRGTPGILGIVFALIALLPASAQQLVSQLRWEQYTIANGLPSNRVLCVVSDGDQIWAGTDYGLALIIRGHVAKIFTTREGLVNQVVTALTVDPDTGDLWIATYGGLGHYSAGTFQNYTNLSSGLANDIVYDVAVQHGIVWAATAAGLSRFEMRTGSWTTFDTGNTPMADPWPVAISLDGGHAYVATWGSGVLEYDIAANQWVSHKYGEEKGKGSAPSNTKPDLDFATGVVFDPISGVVWTATRDGLIQQEERTWNEYTTLNSGLASNFINALHLRDGKLWLCTENGLSVFELKTSTWTTYREFRKTRHGETSIEDQNDAARKVLRSDGSSESNVFNVAFDGTDIWVASESGLFLGTLGRGDLTGRFGQRGRIPGEDRGKSASDGAAPSSKKPNSPSRQMAVNVGLFGPVENGPETPYGIAMRRGAELALDDANNSGGYLDRVHRQKLKYELKIHDDSALWGASTTEPVKMAINEHVVAILGSIDGSSTHILLRIANELGVPVINTGTTDPTITDSASQWLAHLLPDDRQQSYVLARYVRAQKVRFVGVLREDARYARFGAEAFSEALKKVGNISAIEATFQSGETDFTRQLRQFNDAGIDGLVIWCRPPEAALILKQMRILGMRAPTFGPGYLATPQLIEFAGMASEGFAAASVLNPTLMDKHRQDFRRNYRARFDEEPDFYASYAYDGVNLLLTAIKKAGPNREGVMRVLRQQRLNAYEGVAGHMFFDENLSNIAPLVMARVEGGTFVYWFPSDPHR